MEAHRSPLWKLDDSRWPVALVYVEGSDGQMPPDIDSLIAIFDDLVARKQRLALVADLTYARPDAARRKRVVDWTKQHWASVRADLVGVAAVTPGAFQRAIITGLLWFVEPTCPVETFEHRDAALAWAAARF